MLSGKRKEEKERGCLRRERENKGKMRFPMDKKKSVSERGEKVKSG